MRDRLELRARSRDVPETRVGIGAAAGEEPQEVRLARAVGSEHGDAVAEPDLQVERLHEAGELEPLGDHRALAGAGAAQPQLEVLLGRALFGRSRLLELRQPRLGRTVARGEVVARGRLDLERRDECLELRVLLVPAAAQLVEPVHPVGARRVVGGEAAAVHPRRAAGGAGLERDDAVRGTREQLAVVRDEQHGLRRRAQLLLEPSLSGHVEVVVGLVEQQHVVGTAQQRLEHEALLLAARQRRELAEPRPLERHAECGDGALVPHGLVLVAPGIRVVGERRGVAQLRVEVVVLDDRGLGGLEFDRGGADAARSDVDEQLVHGRPSHRADAVPDELVHHAERAADRHDAPVRGLVTPDDAEEGRLARAVRADQRGGRPLADAEGHLIEQLPAVGKPVRDRADVDVAHDLTCAPLLIDAARAAASVGVRSAGPREASRPEYPSASRRSMGRRSGGGVPPRGDRAGPGLRGLFFAVLRRGHRDQVLQEVTRDVGDLVHGAVEGLLIGLRGLRRARDLADVLQGRGVDLVVRRRRLEVVERVDVPAHGHHGTPRRRGPPGRSQSPLPRSALVSRPSKKNSRNAAEPANGATTTTSAAMISALSAPRPYARASSSERSGSIVAR